MSEAVFYPIFLKLPTENIVELIFVLENYEGIGVVHTLSADQGEVVILAVSDSNEILDEILKDVGPRLGIRAIPRPELAEEHWLLSSE